MSIVSATITQSKHIAFVCLFAVIFFTRIKKGNIREQPHNLSANQHTHAEHMHCTQKTNASCTVEYLYINILNANVPPLACTLV